MRLRFLAALLLGALVCASTTPRASAATGHGCAPQTPPPVPGSPVPPPATPGIVLINEVLSTPGSTWNCAEQNQAFSINTDSWVELYNPQNQPFNLYTAHASFDSGPNTCVYYFPFGAAIAPHGYLVLFPSVYAGMLLAGANLRLVIAGTVIDQVSIPALPTDQSYACIPDGSHTWQITNAPTISGSNMASQPIATPTPSSSGQGSSGGQPGGTSSGKPRLVNGTQPAWSKLQLPPASDAPTAASNAPLITPASSPPSVSSAPAITRRILSSLLVIALALMLFWCWRLFRAR